MNLPNNPMMLLSVINTQLRNRYPSLEELAAAYMVDKKEIEKKLAEIDYHYDIDQNKFV